MPSRTPKFDGALAEYYRTLGAGDDGVALTCRLSGDKFHFSKEDIEQCQKFGVPLPTLSPRERIRRMCAFGNIYNVFKTVSEFTGKKIISQYPELPSAPPVFEHQHWYSRKWEPSSYGRTYDPSHPFFEQFGTLLHSVPHPSLRVDNTSTESDYSNGSTHLKNCYFVFDSYEGEDSLYSIGLFNTRNSMDCFTLYDSDRCYDCFESVKLYNCFFAEYSKYCLHSAFLYDCHGCEYCFGCTNLRHKKYNFFNEQLSKEAYEEKMKSLRLGDRRVLEEVRSRFNELKARAIYKENHNEKSIHSSGDYIKNSKRCRECFYANGSENVSYSLGAFRSKDSVALAGGAAEESCYESLSCEESYGLKFCSNMISSNTSEYSELCQNCHDCFGCVGLRDSSFCILNTQYTEDEYWALLDEIKTAMLVRREYGEFFPPSASPVPYNVSIATSYKGYDDLALAEKYGYRIEVVPEGDETDAGKPIIHASDLSADIRDVSDDILNYIIFDEKNNKKFFFIKRELDFYRRFDLPLPQEHFIVRMLNQRKKFGSILLELHNRPCDKCGNTMESSYTKDDPRTVYCEICYLKTIL